MVNGQSQPSTQDTPPVLALIGLGLVVGAYAYFESPTTFSFIQKGADRYVNAHVNFLCVTLFFLSMNVVWLYSIIARIFGFQKQGSRLEFLTGKRPDDGGATGASGATGLVGATGDSWKAALVSLAIGLSTYGVLALFSFPGNSELTPLLFSPGARDHILNLLRINIGMFAFVVAFVLGRMPLWKRLSQLGLRGLFRGRGIPEMPKPENGIALGTVGEDSPNETPEWAVMNRRALNGNIIATGSPGTGKTQGFILSSFDQILGNFKLRPSILAIDPKGTFIPEALKIIERHGLSEHVLHLRLGGNVTFNPIFNLNPLKGARFLDTAQMIRAAAVNFMGKNFDSPFWELSSFNLIKNCLVLCGAKYLKADFNLNNLYNEMIVASKDAKEAAKALRDLAPDLIHEKQFDDEERFNIECAAKYFEEFEQLDDKVRTGILATSTAFLNQFQEYQASRIFCPKNEQATIKSMDEVIDNGKIILFDVASPALARSMGTFIKLHYEQSILNRLADTKRGKDRTAFLIIDEYQDVVSTGGGSALGDDRFTSKSREANGSLIVATQSHSSLKNSIGKDDAAKELLQNFRTVIACHSTDITTIKNFQELAGQEDRKRYSHSVSENSHRPSRNLMLGGFESNDANISESVSTSEHKEYSVTGKEFSRLTAFEAFSLLYDGIQNRYKKLFLKPYYLKKKNTTHKVILTHLKAAVLGAALSLMVVTSSFAFPNVCTVVNTSEFNSCLSFEVGTCMCGFPVPRPCANFSYYVPQTFIEVFPNPKSSYFGDLPGAAVQLSTLGSLPVPFGAEADDDTQSFHAHALGVPLAMIPFSTLPCTSARVEQTCFDAMSEHLGSNWSTGGADLLQPNFMAWSLSPKACLLKGAATSLAGELEPNLGGAGAGCSIPMGWLPKYPPSTHSACTGWGTFYPRSGVYHGPSQTTGALMVASRMKSLGGDVFHTTPASIDEVWQMITPQSSSCFREGQNVGVLDTIKNVRELGRLTSGKLTGYLFTVWSKVSCCRDLALVPAAYIALEAMSVACKGAGSL
ncbi:type IV secretion system DNA-binding domain-containing protein [Bdellovibrionota bacterium FG-2]